MSSLGEMGKQSGSGCDESCYVSCPEKIRLKHYANGFLTLRVFKKYCSKVLMRVRTEYHGFNSFHGREGSVVHLIDIIDIVTCYVLFKVFWGLE